MKQITNYKGNYCENVTLDFISLHLTLKTKLYEICIK